MPPADPGAGEGVGPASPIRAKARRRRAALRSIAVATGGAFAGGVAVFGVQYGLTVLSARYPPLVQAVQCDAPELDEPEGVLLGAAAPARLRLGETDTGVMLPVVPLGTQVTCRLDAPGADYAAWMVAGTRMRFRSGPLDFAGECQSGEDFAGQKAEQLSVSACQRFTLAEPGLHLITVKVMARGVAGLDRGQVAFVVQRPAPPPPAATRLAATLLLPARTAEAEERVGVSQSFDEHGLTPQSRDFNRVVYRLQAGESFRSASFEASSAAQASSVRTAYQAAQRAVTLSFTLRSGPLYDRWRGWLSGAVVVRLTREAPAREVALPDTALAIPGQASIPLPPEALEAGERFVLRLARPDGGTAEVAPGGAVVLDGARIALRLEGKALVLEAKR